MSSVIADFSGRGRAWAKVDVDKNNPVWNSIKSVLEEEINSSADNSDIFKRCSSMIDLFEDTGIAWMRFAGVNNKSKVLCIDPNKKMLLKGKEKLSNLKNIQWKIGNAENLPVNNDCYEYYSISFGIRNVTDINITLKEAYRVLKSGGRFMCLEFSKISNSNLKFL